MIIKKFMIVFVLLIASTVFAQDDFKWDWEGGGGEKAESGKLRPEISKPAAPVADDLAPLEDDLEDLPELKTDGEPVNWDWEAGVGDEGGNLRPEVKKPAAPVAVPDAPVVIPNNLQPPVAVPDNLTTKQPNNLQPPVAPVDNTAFKDLLNENLGLRTEIDQMLLNNKAKLKENERLVRQVAELGGSITRLSKLIDDYETEKVASDDDTDKVVSLELKLTEVESEKIRLEKERAKLKDELVLLERKMRETPTVKVPVNASPKPGSDLYKRVKAENTLLRAKMIAIEQEKINAVRGRDAARVKEGEIDKFISESKQRSLQLEHELDVAREKRKQQEKLIGKLLDEIPDLEKKVVKLNEKVTKSAEELMIKDRDINVYRTELEKRDDRLKKAEKMASLLEKSRAEVQAVSNSEKRDMHYNMAVVYSKEGRLQDAEREYLRALRLDPNDADVHYNLGILYDDELDNNRRAALHYKKYINLRPFAKDIDQIRIWLMECEMK